MAETTRKVVDLAICIAPQQISLLRFAPIEMTILAGRDACATFAAMRYAKRTKQPGCAAEDLGSSARRSWTVSSQANRERRFETRVSARKTSERSSH